MTKQEKKRDYAYRRRYGLTLAQYTYMEVRQEGRCAICLGNPTNRRLHVDHDHRDKRVRGLVCFRCNKFRIGRAHLEDAPYFRRIANYLESTFDGRNVTCESIAQVR